MEIISVNNVCKSYGKLRALDGISFTVNKGDIIGYIGPNGSGKTTTISAITNLCNIDKGQINIYGEDNRINYGKNLSKISIINENNGLYDGVSAVANLKFFTSAVNMDKKEAQKRIDELLYDFNLFDRRKDPIKKYSKGMKRKLEIARAIIYKPEILILDEPFDGIDVESKISIITLLKEYAQRNNISIILTSHIMEDIENLANRIIILKTGKKILDESTETFMNRAYNKYINIEFAENIDYKKFVNINNESGLFNILKYGNKYIKCQAIDDNINIYEIIQKEDIHIRDIYIKRDNINEIYLRMVKS